MDFWSSNEGLNIDILGPKRRKSSNFGLKFSIFFEYIQIWSCCMLLEVKFDGDSEYDKI